MYQALPGFLKKTDYKNPSDDMNTIFQDAWQESRHVFMWLAERPNQLAYFNDYMALRRKREQSWISVYPVKEKTADWDPERPVFVDVGGSIGHQCAHLKETYPDIPGKVILQDLPNSVANALPTPGVENMAHDFFQAQPVEGKQSPSSTLPHCSP